MHFTYGSDGNYPYSTNISFAGGARSIQIDWNSASGTPISQTDPQNSISVSYGFDALLRPTSITEAGKRRTTYIYDDAARKVTVKKDLETLGDGKLQTVTHYDQLGRERLPAVCFRPTCNPLADRRRPGPGSA